MLNWRLRIENPAGAHVLKYLGFGEAGKAYRLSRWTMWVFAMATVILQSQFGMVPSSPWEEKSRAHDVFVSSGLQRAAGAEAPRPSATEVAPIEAAKSPENELGEIFDLRTQAGWWMLVKFALVAGILAFFHGRSFNLKKTAPPSEPPVATPARTQSREPLQFATRTPVLPAPAPPLRKSVVSSR